MKEVVLKAQEAGLFQMEGPPLPAVSLAGMMQMQDAWLSGVGREQITD